MPIWIAGGKRSFADVCLFDCVEAVEGVGFFSCSDRVTYPYVNALVEHFSALPAVRAYLDARPPRF